MQQTNDTLIPKGQIKRGKNIGLKNSWDFGPLHLVPLSTYCTYMAKSLMLTAFAQQGEEEEEGKILIKFPVQIAMSLSSFMLASTHPETFLVKSFFYSKLTSSFFLSFPLFFSFFLLFLFLFIALGFPKSPLRCYNIDMSRQNFRGHIIIF